MAAVEIYTKEQRDRVIDGHLFQMGQLRDVVHYYTQGVQIVGLWHFVAHH
jgi:hypothetical protein